MALNISAKEVNELRQKTGSGMMDCKKALVQAEGDFNKAIDILRKKVKKYQKLDRIEKHQRELSFIN